MATKQQFTDTAQGSNEEPQDVSFILYHDVNAAGKCQETQLKTLADVANVDTKVYNMIAIRFIEQPEGSEEMVSQAADYYNKLIFTSKRYYSKIFETSVMIHPNVEGARERNPDFSTFADANETIAAGNELLMDALENERITYEQLKQLTVGLSKPQEQTDELTN